MSWTDIFPVLTDELIDDYRRGATDAERAEMEEWLGGGAGDPGGEGAACGQGGRAPPRTASG